jgi:hypothetical protein
LDADRHRPGWRVSRHMAADRAAFLDRISGSTGRMARAIACHASMVLSIL